MKVLTKLFYKSFSYWILVWGFTFPYLGKGFASDLKWLNTTQEIFAFPIDTSASVDFLFTNTSDKTITITNLTTSCGCTTAELNKRTYQAGETGSIHALFQFGHRLGLQKKQIKVQTDETNASLTTLYLRVQIPRIVQIIPETLSWTNGENTAKLLRVTTTNEPNIIITDIVNSNPKLFKVTSLQQTNRIYEWSILPLDSHKPNHTVFYLNASINGTQRAFKAKAEIQPSIIALSE